MLFHVIQEFIIIITPEKYKFSKKKNNNYE